MTDKLALEFRTKGAALARAKTEGFVGIYFGLSTTLGTRVRCEVLDKSQHYIVMNIRVLLLFIF
jgi:hypothetical protein